MSTTISFNELRSIKDSLPDGSIHKIAEELNVKTVEIIENVSDIASVEYKVNPSTVNIRIYDKISVSKEISTDIIHKSSLDTKLNIENVEVDLSGFVEYKYPFKYQP